MCGSDDSARGAVRQASSTMQGAYFRPHGVEHLVNRLGQRRAIATRYIPMPLLTIEFTASLASSGTIRPVADGARGGTG